jgi:threonine dehydrogenase-like Zn-dependent dehydrogenase
LDLAGSDLRRQDKVSPINSNHPTVVAKTIASITGTGVDHLLEITGDPALYEAAGRIVNPRGHLAGSIVRHERPKKSPGGQTPLPTVSPKAKAFPNASSPN